nr:unnamed protein product [Callosobruchus analis]
MGLTVSKESSSTQEAESCLSPKLHSRQASIRQSTIKPKSKHPMPDPIELERRFTKVLYFIFAFGTLDLTLAITLSSRILVTLHISASDALQPVQIVFSVLPYKITVHEDSEVTNDLIVKSVLWENRLLKELNSELRESYKLLKEQIIYLQKELDSTKEALSKNTQKGTTGIQLDIPMSSRKLLDKKIDPRNKTYTEALKVQSLHDTSVNLSPALHNKGTIYRSPNGCFDTFLEQLDKLLSDINNYGHVMLAGDYNVHFGSSQREDILLCDLLSYGFEPTFTEPTRGGFQMVSKAFREFSQQCVSKCRLQICQANRQTLDLGKIDPLCIKMCKQSVRMSK